MALAPDPMTATSLSGQVDRVVPPGRVPGRSGKGVEALEVGDVGPVELTTGEHDSVRLELRVAVGSAQRQSPGPGPPVELGTGDGRGQAEVGPEVELLDEVLGVGEDLGLLREASAPVGLRGERERVQLGGDVAGGPRVDVVPPGPADAVGLLDDGEAAHPRPDELGGGGQARQPATDDGHGRHGTPLHVRPPNLPFEGRAADVQCHASPSPDRGAPRMRTDDIGGGRCPSTAPGTSPNAPPRPLNIGLSEGYLI